MTTDHIDQMFDAMFDAKPRLAKDSDAALWDFVNRGRLPPD